MNNPQSIYYDIQKSGPESLQSISHSIDNEDLTRWLNDPNWKIRNIGIKIIHSLERDNMVGKLIELLTDRRPVSFLDRIMGGDFYQVGFIRRNAAAAIGDLAAPSPEIAAALHKALEDPYWEVRVEAVKACRKLFTEDMPDELHKSIESLLHDSKFEVVAEAITYLGEISEDSAVIDLFRSIYDHPNYYVKIALINALKRLHKRMIIAERSDLIKELNDIFIPGFYLQDRNNK